MGYIFLIGMPKPKEGYKYFLFPHNQGKVEPSPFHLVDEKTPIYVCPWDVGMFRDAKIVFQVYAVLVSQTQRGIRDDKLLLKPSKHG